VHIYYQQYAGQLFMHDLRMKIFRKLQVLDLSFFDRNPIGRLVTRATNDVEAINEALANVFATLFRDILLLVGIVVILFSINLRLALIAFTVVPLVLVLTSYFRIRARDIYRRVRTRLARLNAALQENLSGVRVIKIFSQERSNQARFDRINKDYLEANLQEVVLMSFFRPVVEIISSLGIGLVLYYGGGRVITGQLSLGVLVAFVAYVEMFFRPIRELTESYTILQSAMASSERIFILLDEPVGITSAQQAVALKEPRGEIEFKDVWFAYGATASAKSDSEIDWVLKNVSFKVMPGERVAIVGPTGAGKTSIISLISRLYDVQKGEILIDGINVKDLALPSLRSRIGVVMQDVFLFAGDIKSNIRLNLDLEDERVREVAAHINADKFIDRFPNKYDEAVMERGITLSTGERQLLSFARVLAFDPKILVLDEATASIDSETERLIQDGMQRLVMGRTAIIIAHRLSTIREVDRIYVIHRGEIKEVGNHDELVKKKGIYHSLLKLQSVQ
jgi:ABC-type multidrug transport system fused ATPase/permease subunit